MPERIGLKPYIILMRPFTLFAPAVAMICGMVMALLHHSDAHRFIENGLVILLSAVSMSLAQMCGQIINQAEDPSELDVINGKTYRPIPMGIITPTQARWIGLGIGAISLVLAFIINRQLGIGIAVILFFAIFYSLEPIRAKRRSLLNIVWLGISRGFLPLIIAWSVFYTPWEPIPIILSAILFFWVAAFNITKDFPDITGDQAFNIPTLPVKRGIENTKRFMQVVNALALGILIIAVITGTLRPTYLIAIIIFIISIPMIRNIDKRGKPTKAVENTPGWRFFYIGLGLLYILFTIATAIP